MNPQIFTPDASNGALGLLLVIGLACWCWFSSGPLFLRWPLVVLIVLMTSGHWLGGVVGAYVGALAGPILLLLIVFAGLMIMLRGLGLRGRSRNNRDYRYNGRRGWYGDRW